ncbi:flavin prenyltransferase [Candidatus Hakubella thermalkaliphila]|uniref:Flavin prenyltransferase UbiX n=1 Tax=Candidatus Hakubella thermalkaliphila TaxID=2754717 RepID=A0A6V8PBA5_9ACTN|nr:flavin prenyltransferase UbiX [Candidatus Hakubella thermalkaliphila]GFP19302.1 flavin prenyltransferase [Candidatus Hakubella thermalkaliphila]GFP22856.1 flavin prenyltransferase [Candidatus Hakubella thermalkaliphila]GFP29340.1 flavin prenyltransferase [Candidatus Hakubella thermalkaliphila]GFP37405.1 flavin prenyltransferase [Candidatus Hakubella thermalkaliphila]
MSKLVVAITGASGAIYGKRLAEELLSRGKKLILLISKNGWLILQQEMNFLVQGDEDMVSGKLRAWFGLDEEDDRVVYYHYDNLLAPLASGSSRASGMIICPCSMATVAAIAHGFSSNLITRTADVMLKENKPLILVPRETPLNEIHLQNLLTLKRCGAQVVPAMPAFYHKPQTVEDIVDFMVGKILDLLGAEHKLFKRWEGYHPD